MKAQPHYPEPSPETLLVRYEEVTVPLRALGTLKPENQEVLRLRAHEGLSMKQISMAVGCTEEAARSA